MSNTISQSPSPLPLLLPLSLSPPLPRRRAVRARRRRRRPLRVACSHRVARGVPAVFLRHLASYLRVSSPLRLTLTLSLFIPSPCSIYSLDIGHSSPNHLTLAQRAANDECHCRDRRHDADDDVERGSYYAVVRRVLLFRRRRRRRRRRPPIVRFSVFVRQPTANANIYGLGSKPNTNELLSRYRRQQWQSKTTDTCCGATRDSSRTGANFIAHAPCQILF
jgi:hypothetical protein